MKRYLGITVETALSLPINTNMHITPVPVHFLQNCYLLKNNPACCKQYVHGRHAVSIIGVVSVVHRSGRELSVRLNSTGQMFQGIPNLRQLSLTNNNIRVIQPMSFSQLANMLLLDLSQNKIQVVQPGAFAGTGLATIALRGTVHCIKCIPT